MKYLKSLFRWKKEKSKFDPPHTSNTKYLDYSNILDILSDCLQEIFDKYRIKYSGSLSKANHGLGGGGGLNSEETIWCIKNPITTNILYPYVLITNIPYEGELFSLLSPKEEDLGENTFFYNLLDNIRKIKPFIRKRINKDISVKFTATTRSGGSIFIFPDLK